MLLFLLFADIFASATGAGYFDEDDIYRSRSRSHFMNNLNSQPANNLDNGYMGQEDRMISKESIYQQGSQGQFLQFLRKIGYDRGQHPENKDGEPVVVEVSLLVSNIRSVSEINMDYSLEVFFRESWRDPRLQFGDNDFNKGFYKTRVAASKNASDNLVQSFQTLISLHESYSDFLWRPDTFVPNAINSKTPSDASFTHRALYRLRQDGMVITSRRISLVVECSLDLTRYPFDKQLCKLGLESYGYTADQITYNWSKDKEPLELYPIRLPDFIITKAYATKRNVDYATGSYTRLYVCFEFTRSAGYCFLQLIIPSFAVVMTAWISLWRESESSFQDMITILMSIIFLLYSYNSVMPRVSYIKAMDVYLGVCFAVAFLALVKLSIMTFMKIRIERENSDMYISVQKDVDVRDTTSVTSNVTKRNTIFTNKFMLAFHYGTQLLLFVGFVGFCIYYFFIYPKLEYQQYDADCDPAITVTRD